MSGTASAPSAACDIKEIQFGFASAEMEGAHKPRLLLDGYLDPFGLVKSALNEHRFLYLGYKGSGKTAIAEHLRLLSESDPHLFVKTLSLSDFPFTPFSKLIKGDTEPEAKYPTAWSWLFLLQLLDSFGSDEAIRCDESDELTSSIVALKNVGLLPQPSLRQSVLISTKHSFGGSLARLLSGSVDKTFQHDATSIPTFAERLKALVLNVRSSSKHVLVIDGLDDILTKRSVQYDALSALIFEAQRLNTEFARIGVPGKILVLCRTDLFERLPGANTNKIRQDCGLHLDWYHDPRNPEDSALIRLINKRAGLSLSREVDFFETYLPPAIPKGTDGDSRPIRTFLLELTRHTPRDMIMLVSQLQRFADARSRMSTREVLSATAAYSREYFLPEIKNELAGYVPIEEIDQVVQLLGSLRQRDFTLGQLEQQARFLGYKDTLSFSWLQAVMKALFECSAVGNVDTWPNGSVFFTFRYRNRHSAFSPEKKIILHTGIWKALNLV